MLSRLRFHEKSDDCSASGKNLSSLSENMSHVCRGESADLDAIVIQPLVLKGSGRIDSRHMRLKYT